MINRDIYTNALALLSQNISGEFCEDLEERAPYLLANFCREALELDKLIRSLSGLSAHGSFNGVFLDLDADFPLRDRIASVAAKYLAAMLIIDENSDLSDRLYDAYCDAMATIQCSIPSVVEKIKNNYL